MKTSLCILFLIALPFIGFAESEAITDILPPGKYQLNTSLLMGNGEIPKISSQSVTIAYKESQPYITIGDDELKVYYNGEAFFFYNPPKQESDGASGIVLYNGEKLGGRLVGKKQWFAVGNTNPLEENFNLVPVKE